jgi:glutathione S-transferase
MAKPAQPFVIHHIEGRRSERIAWLCEELGLPYELRFVPGDLMASLAGLEQAHVMRMAPVFDDGPVRLVESAAILEYILLRYGEGRLRPANDAPEMADYLQWLHFAEGSGMFRGMMERLLIELAGENPPPMLAFIYLGGSRKVLTFAERALAKHPYFAGDAFTAADIMMHFPLRLAPLAMRRVTAVTPLFHDDRQGLEEFPHVNAFLDRMAARPAFQRAMKATMPSGPPPA